jgi:hypothetical protein
MLKLEEKKCARLFCLQIMFLGESVRAVKLQIFSIKPFMKIFNE